MTTENATPETEVTEGTVAENTGGEASGEASTETKETRTRVDVETFITVWEDSDSVGEVAERLNLKPNSVTQRATKYRKTYGVALKKMTGGGAKFDAEAANALLARLRGETDESEAPANESVSG